MNGGSPGGEYSSGFSSRIVSEIDCSGDDLQIEVYPSSSFCRGEHFELNVFECTDKITFESGFRSPLPVVCSAKLDCHNCEHDNTACDCAEDIQCEEGGGPTSINGNTFGATPSFNPCCGEVTEGLWYKVPPFGKGIDKIMFSICGKYFSKISLFTGCCGCSSFDCNLDCNDPLENGDPNVNIGGLQCVDQIENSNETISWIADREIGYYILVEANPSKDFELIVSWEKLCKAQVKIEIFTQIISIPTPTFVLATPAFILGVGVDNVTLLLTEEDREVLITTVTDDDGNNASSPSSFVGVPFPEDPLPLDTQLFCVDPFVCTEINALPGSTAGYMAPEIITKKRYGVEVDYWSLGITLFEC